MTVARKLKYTSVEQIENPEILPFVQDYKIHLLAPIRIKDEEFLKFKSGLGASLMCIKHSKDKEFDILKHPIYETIDIKTARLIKEIANMKFKLEDYQKEGGTVNMCEAYRRSQEKARDEGRLDGLREGTMNGRLMDIKNLMDSFQLTAEQAMDALKIPKEERASYLEKL